MLNASAKVDTIIIIDGLQEFMLTNPPISFDLYVGVPSTYGLTPAHHSVLNVKALVGAFNQEKALEGAVSVIMKTDESFVALKQNRLTEGCWLCGQRPVCGG